MKYLFKALIHPKDGSSDILIEQGHDDISPTTPGKNCFYDVLQRIDEVRAFAFYNQETNVEYLVDLADGHFEIGAQPFFMHDVRDEPLTNIRLVYFKRNTLLFNPEPGQPRELDPEFHFGWQANLPNGQNIKRVMVLK